VTAPYVKRLRKLLLLLPALGKAALRNKGIPIDRAVEISGARNEKELREGIEILKTFWTTPDEGEGELPIDLHEENGELSLTYAEPFGTLTAFSLAEGAVLLAALAPFERDGARPVTKAIAKLRRAIPEVLREDARALSRGLDVAIAAPEPWAGVLGEAISRRLEAVVEYRAVADDQVVPRTVEPRLLFQRDGQWYLAAWNVEKGEEHLYRLDRIASVVPGTRVFDRHQGPATARYAKNLFFESGREREVTLRYAGVAARHARRREGARLREEPGGTVSVTSRCNPGNYLFGVLLGAGGEAAVAGPADVVARFEERLAELEGMYR
jgi:proteasome accessory factor C